MSSQTKDDVMKNDNCTYEPFYRNDTYPKNDTDQFLPKMSSTCSLAVYVFDLVEKMFS